MTEHRIGTQEEWQAERDQLLMEEKVFWSCLRLRGKRKRVSEGSQELRTVLVRCRAVDQCRDWMVRETASTSSSRRAHRVSGGCWRQP